MAHLDNYFEQLDAAFQTLGNSAPAEPPKESAAASLDAIDWFGATPAAEEPRVDLPLSSPALVEHVEPEPEPEPEPPTMSVFHPEPVAARPEPVALSSPAPPPPAPPPLSAAAVRAAASHRAAGISAAAGRAAHVATSPPRRRQRRRSRRHGSATAPPPPGTLPPIADAFAAILAAEQHEPMPALAPAWPAGAAPSNGGASLGEEAIEEITRRVLDRLSDQVVRNTVADVISGIAERLVTEEIERIKASIK